MTIKDTIIISFESLLHSKMRTLLSLLGIIIGVGSVVASLTLGKSASQSIIASMDYLNGSQILIFVDSSQKIKFFQNDFNLMLSSAFPELEHVLPIQNGKFSIESGKKVKKYTVDGVDSQYFNMQVLSFNEGNQYVERDSLLCEAVVVLGSRVAKTLFPAGHAVGKSIIIKGRFYRVIGVLNSKEPGMIGSYDNTLYIPFSTYQRYLAEFSKPYFFVASVKKGVDSIATGAAVKEYLKKHARPNSYDMFTPATYLNMRKGVNSKMSALLAAVAGISLLVGGIGIMNIMLVSVAERTVEIGIRKATGAKTKDILMMFLTESLVLSFIGGIIGLALAELICTIVMHIMKWPFVISIPAITLSFGFSFCTGLFFGSYPASRASKLNPIEALNKI